MSQTYLCDCCGQSNPLKKLLYRSRGREEDVELAHWARTPRSQGLRPVTELLGTPVHRALRALFGEDSQNLQSQGQVVLHCPFCKQPLSERNVVQENHVSFLGIFGPRTSGKTLFMISLVQGLSHQPIEDRTLGLVGLRDSNERLNVLADQLRRGEKPRRTPEEKRGSGQSAQQSAKTQRYAWQLQIAGTGQRRFPSALLSLYDMSGEDLARPHEEDRPVLESYCRAVTSLVFLIDGKAVARDLKLPVKDAWDPNEGSGSSATDDVGVLRNVRDRIGEVRAKKSVDIALVLSKADYLWDQDGWEALKPERRPMEENGFQQLMEKLLTETGRSGLLTQARGFRSMKLFAASSLGFRPGRNDVKNGRLTSTRKIKPEGVTDAVTWLLGLRLPALRRSSS